jgi:predicted metal-dependent peptidase
MDAAIDRAIREGALLAGRLGANVPRSITELLDPLVDWRKELAEFVSAYTKGRDEYTWRKFNRRLVANDIFMPTVENETVGEIVVAIDTSGSIGQAQINEFASELVSICEAVSPEAVRVLWWDTMVHGEQRFTDNYQNIGSMLKPQGGGGTRVGCVAEYINKHKVNAECLLVFTDGFVENSPEWGINVPTLWFVTCNKNWTPPAGRAVMVD